MRETWVYELATSTSPKPCQWLWQGYIAPGATTLLTSQWKSGKTTLVALLLARMAQGGTLAGLSVAAGRAAVVTEESAELWLSRAQRLNLSRHVCLFSRPFGGRPTEAKIEELAARLEVLQAEHGVGVVVIDTLAAFLPGGVENLAGRVLEVLSPLATLTARGMAVLLLHHPSKGASAAGQAARGSGALGGLADIVVEMQWCRGHAGTDRRRRLRAWSRYRETPSDLIIELSSAEDDYAALGDGASLEFARGYSLIERLLSNPRRQLTRRQMLKEWPPEETAPSEAQLWRWLDESVQRGLVCHEGSGRKLDPYRYWLVSGEKPIWLQDPAETWEALLADGWKQVEGRTPTESGHSGLKSE